MIPPRTLIRTGTLPVTPTEALPGTEEKIRVMILRAARRQQLFHPMDGPRAKLYPPTEVPDELLIASLEPAPLDEVIAEVEEGQVCSVMNADQPSTADISVGV
jgi:hypothetical protein